MPARRKFDHEAAYQFWANLPDWCRTYAEVAEEFAVSDVAIGKVARREKWHRRVRSKDIAARRKVMGGAVRIRVQQIRSGIHADSWPS